jgi:hypothetical protein
MKTQATEPLETYLQSGQELRIRWNKTSYSRNGQIVYEADEAICHFMDNRSSIIQKIIGEAYDVGSELATINNKDRKPDEYAAYQSFREQAKALADGWLNR